MHLLTVYNVNNLCGKGNFANSTLQNQKIISIFVPKILHE